MPILICSSPTAWIGSALDQVDQAKRICAACPVRRPCLAWALDQRAVSGIWGGTSEVERHAIRQATTTRNRMYETRGTRARPERPTS
jgi:WhiB family transcriptional regulator, redox-sensing transcriptional regulator